MKKKILFVDQNSSLGGGQRVLLDLMKFSLEMGHNPFLMLPSEGYVTEQAKALNIPFSIFPFPNMTAGKKNFIEKIFYPFHSFRSANKIEEYAFLNEIDIIFANGPRIFLPCVIAGKRIGKSVHLQLHLLFEKGAEKKLIEILLRTKSVKSAVACSKKVYEPFKDIFPQKMKVVAYWVSPPFLNEKNRREELRKKYNLSESNIAIGVIGRISPTKGQVFCLESLFPLLQDKKEVVLFFGGSSDFENPQEEKILKSKAEESSFSERIKILGAVEGLDFYDALDILIVPSLWEEPFGLVAVEGMARELPLVVTRSGALAETVLDGETGFVVEKDKEHLRGKVRILVDSLELRKNMGFRGKQRVLENFNPPVQMKKILDIAVEDV